MKRPAFGGRFVFGMLRLHAREIQPVPGRPMGSGKSAVGKQLSRLPPPFFTAISRSSAAPVSISPISSRRGETGFRQRESETLEVLTAMERIVLATAEVRPVARNRRLLAERGCVVY